MRAIVCRGHAHADEVRIEDVPAPPMIEGGVRIASRLIGVSFATGLVLQGRHQNTPALPFVPGTELAGEVIEVAAGITHVKPGDRVLAGVRHGAWAQEAVAPALTVHRLPDAVDFAAALHFPTLYATAYAALVWRARVQPGETVLVLGAGGGSGLTAVGVAHCLGARVIAVAGSPGKLQAAREAGADHAFDHHEVPPWSERVRELTAGRGVDVVFDPVGGEAFDEAMRCLAPDGRMIPMGFASGGIPQVPANRLLVKNVSMLGVYWGYYVGWGRIAPPPHIAPKVRAAFDELLGWCAQGRLRPRTWRTYPMDAFREALGAISSREVIGRVALRP